jgi:hypothetical protein
VGLSAKRRLFPAVTVRPNARLRIMVYLLFIMSSSLCSQLNEFG